MTKRSSKMKHAKLKLNVAQGKETMTSCAMTLVKTHMCCCVGRNSPRVLSFYWRDALSRVLTPALTALRHTGPGCSLHIPTGHCIEETSDAICGFLPCQIGLCLATIIWVKFVALFNNTGYVNANVNANVNKKKNNKKLMCVFCAPLDWNLNLNKT